MIIIFLYEIKNFDEEMRATREMIRADVKLHEAAHELLKAYSDLCRTMYATIVEREEAKDDPT